MKFHRSSAPSGDGDALAASGVAACRRLGDRIRCEHDFEGAWFEERASGGDPASGTAEWAIVGTGLCKSYGETVVLEDTALNVDGGTIFALLGPNGEDKITMARIMSTLVLLTRAKCAGAPGRFRCRLALSCHRYSPKDSTPPSTIG